MAKYIGGAALAAAAVAAGAALWRRRRLAVAGDASVRATGGGPVVLVTGGTGLVGRGIRHYIEGAGRAAAEGETWIFLSSKDGDLR